MKAEYKDNENLGPGNGKLVFSEAILPEGPWEVSIQRASDQNFLTGKKRNQWVGENFFMPLPGEALAGGSLELLIGPSVVDSLDQRDQYRITLKGADGNQETGRLKVGAISHSLGESRDNTAAGPNAQDPPAPAAETAATAEAAPHQPEQPATPQAAPTAQTPLEMPQASARPPRYWRYLIILLLAAGCLAWYLLDKRQQGENPPQEVRPVTIEDKAPAPGAGGQPKTPGQAEGGKAAPHTEAEVFGFFKGSNHTPAEALALAEKLPKKTQAEQDAIYRLYYFAGENASPAGLLEYGACLDPSRPQWGTIQKDGALAWEIYEKARQRQTKGAEQAMTQLKKWLEDQTAAGNRQASQWLRQIK